MTNNYAQAIFELLQKGQSVDQVLTNVKQVMSIRGHAKLFGAVLKAVVVLLEQNETKKHAVVVVASKGTNASPDIKTALSVLDAVDAKTVIFVDETIIGGSVVTYQSQQIDQSYKTALKNLYQTITTN